MGHKFISNNPDENITMRKLKILFTNTCHENRTPTIQMAYNIFFPKYLMMQSNVIK